MTPSRLPQDILDQVSQRVVGQQAMVERLLIALLTGGHVLLEGVPGLAKTLTVRTLAETVRTTFSRIQFTPDLLPADVIGTQVFDQATATFSVKQGPIFANIVLADEINRAPAKVQAALLEAMQEKQVTIGGTSFALEEPFLVLATQNPIENEGTYPLPEAQLDRFMLKVRVGYPTRDQEKEVLLRRSGLSEAPVRQLLDPSTILALRESISATYLDQKVVDYIVDLVRATRDEEREIMRRMAGGEAIPVQPVAGPEELLAARRQIAALYLDPKLGDYIVDLIHATRAPKDAGLADLVPLVEYGASPRATIALAQAARAHAYLRGREFVSPDDVKAMAPDVLRHRVLLSFEAEADNVSSDEVIGRILAAVPAP